MVADRDALALIDRSALPASVSLLLEVAGEGEESYEVWRDEQDTHDPHVPVDTDDTALILYTSGTSGLPKGIMLTGRNFGCALYSLNQDIELQEDSVCAAPIPFFHIAGLGLALAANLNGGRLLLETAVDPPAVLRLLIDRRVSHAAVVPTVLQRLLALDGIATRTSPLFATSSTARRPYHCRYSRRPPRSLAASSSSPTVSPSQRVGSRCSGRTTTSPKRRSRDDLTSAGKAMPDAEIRVVDPITFEDVPMGTRGEVLGAQPAHHEGLLASARVDRVGHG